MIPPLTTLLDDAGVLGIEEQFLIPLKKTVDSIRAQLENL